ncbi:OLC1v1017443C1 [Oldenlandia corymbosa var. corymbosa]|uniref:OLC1v1017443C1 n=1 Tax=Oldenlandia corymbosa var. corymbosa TaxID=529605 RepID=A0AAV1E9F9_OLDCO|nr:OLC1v1017443C1 [Oldenlandia corymbosa var. corymbosa]
MELTLNNLAAYNGHGSLFEDGFDCIPDPIALLIFSKISDIKTLLRCRAVSKRFNSLVPQVDSLLLRVDRVISATDSDDDDGDSFFLTFLRSIVKSFHNLISPNKQTVFAHQTRAQNSPAQILRGFESIRSLQIELPSGDLRLEKGTTIKWKAHFGKTLKSCVILAFRGGSDADATGGGLKMRVVWTISALIAASARHYMVLDAVKEQKGLNNLVVKDKDNEGYVVMDKIGLQECREKVVDDEEPNNDNNVVSNNNNDNNNRGAGVWWKSNRTTVPAVRMRMRHEAKMELSNGLKLEGATLVVVRPLNSVGGGSEVEEQSGDVALAMGAFGEDELYGEAVQKLLKSRSYILEMNSF